MTDTVTDRAILAAISPEGARTWRIAAALRHAVDYKWLGRRLHALERQGLLVRPPDISTRSDPFWRRVPPRPLPARPAARA